MVPIKLDSGIGDYGSIFFYQEGNFFFLNKIRIGTPSKITIEY